MTCDGCNKLATDNFSVEKFLAQREEQVVDMDLSACLLVLSMLSPMVFSKRLQFVYTTPMTFSPHNRNSNIFILKARGPVANNEDLDGVDGNKLVELLGKRGGLQDALAGMTLAEHRALFKECVVGGSRTKIGT